MHAYLGALTLQVEYDPEGPLVSVTLPGSEDEVSLNDARDPVGPLALQHFPDRRPAVELPVEYGDIDGVEVYLVTTTLGTLIFPAAIVPVLC